MTLQKIKETLRTNTISANLESTDAEKWVYIAIVEHNRHYQTLKFVVPIDQVDDGFCSVMPAKYLLKHLLIN